MESKTIAIMDSVFWLMRVSAAAMLLINSVSEKAVGTDANYQIQLQDVCQFQVQLVKRPSERKGKRSNFAINEVLVSF